MRQKAGFIAGVIIFTVMLLLPVPGNMETASYRVGCVTVLMAIWWITEAIPISATALIPLSLFPLMRIQSASETAASYGSSHVFLFMGGFIIAVAMEKWDLHRRIALLIISLIGAGKRRIILGFMCATAFLSMWISNTATALMMYPIGLAVVQSIDEVPDGKTEGGGERNTFATAVMLGIAFSASIGGLATLIGTPPNIIFAGTARKLFPAAPEFSFAEWFLMSFPLVVLFIPLSWWYLVSVGFRFTSGESPESRKVIESKLVEMGGITSPEKRVLMVFLATSLGWIFRRDLNLGFLTIPGWSDTLGLNDFVHDATVAMTAAILLFVIPSGGDSGGRLITWKDARQIPWGILILFGGGIALADGFSSSGLSVWIADSISFFHFLPPIFIVVIVCVIMMIMTEFTSNTATASIFMPILAGLAGAVHIHPYILMIPATLAVSCAFVLPVATPPNAIIFGSGRVQITDMVRIGIVFDVIGLILVVSILYYIIFPLMGISQGTFPAWAQ